MADELTFGVYTPSYRRSGQIRTYHVLEHTTYVVRKSEEQAYLDAGIAPEDLWAVEDSLIAGYEMAFEYIVANSPEDVICIIDDDVDAVKYINATEYTVPPEETKEVLQTEIERTAQMLVDLGLGLACSTAKNMSYKYEGPFLLKTIPGSMKIINKAAIRAHMDLDADKMCDIDYVLQELLHNRICLFPMYYSVVTLGKVNKRFGRTRTTGSSYDSVSIATSVDYMENKWGTAFKYNKKSNVPKIMVKR